MNGKPTQIVSDRITSPPDFPDSPDFPNSPDFQAQPGAGARATIVNRTRRVVREQALGMQQQREKTRSLWLPMAICSTLLLVICYAIWAVLDGYDLTPNGVPDASDQMLLLLLWGLPITLVALGLTWLRPQPCEQ